MSSVVTAVLKATVGLLVSKGRDVAARKLKEGDVMDQKFRGLIVREIDDIKSTLEGIARKELLASISFFKEGIEFLYEVFAKVRFSNQVGPLTSQAGQFSSTEASSLSKRMRRLELADLNESASRALANAKERFKDARREATKAFANQALELSDRVLAMQYRVMAIILETVDNPEDALPACRVCIEELHNLSAVKECFKVEFEKGLRARLGKDDRRAIISTVCHVNRVIYNVTLMVCFGNRELESNCPFVDIGQKNIDPLRDTRVAKVLQKQGMGHCCVPWVFGQEGAEENKLKHPRGIVSNTEGHLLVGDEGDASIKVFDSNMNFLLSFNPKADDTDTKLDILDVATDVHSNTYVLVGLKKPKGETGYERKVHVFNKAAEPQSKFAVSTGVWGWNRLTVSNDKLLVLKSTGDAVDMYNQNGGFVGSFGEGILKKATDITASTNGRIMIVDKGESCVHLFTEEGEPTTKFNISSAADLHCRIAWHPAGQHVVIAIKELGRLDVSLAVYNKDGEFVRSTKLEDRDIMLEGVTVTVEGHIAVAAANLYRNGNVIIV